MRLTALTLTPEPPQEDLNLLSSYVSIHTMQQEDLHGVGSKQLR